MSRYTSNFISYPTYPAYSYHGGGGQTEIYPVNVDAESAALLLTVPETDQVVDADFIASTASVFSPEVGPSVEVGAPASSASFFTASVGTSVDVGLVSSSASFFVAVVSPGVSADPPASSADVYAPALELGVEPGHIASGSSVADPQLSLEVAPSLVPSGEVVFTPSLSEDLAPTNIAATSEVFQPSVAGASESVVLDALFGGSTVHAPECDLVIFASAGASTSQVLSPSAGPEELPARRRAGRRPVSPYTYLQPATAPTRAVAVSLATITSTSLVGTLEATASVSIPATATIAGVEVRATTPAHVEAKASSNAFARRAAPEEEELATALLTALSHTRRRQLFRRSPR